MVTGFDYLSRDKALQEHWLRRLVAVLIDAFIIWIPVSAFFGLIGYAWLGFFVFSIESIAFFFYCAFFDYVIGGTLGKMLLRLKAVGIAGKMDIAQALLRNVSKVFVPLLLIDWILGMAIDTNDPRQKFTDQLARTSV
ncbi:MAG: RDD family protein, partial [Candidatus Thermoplasmatota archaeon]|nr:RDD family protein [Candidatus Thermoplasmatota archaeon]